MRVKVRVRARVRVAEARHRSPRPPPAAAPCSSPVALCSPSLLPLLLPLFGSHELAAAEREGARAAACLPHLGEGGGEGWG